jgi:hypothetical protein
MTCLSVTDGQIRGLRVVAHTHGDMDLATVCTLALGDSDGMTPVAEPGTPVAEALERYGLALDGLSNPVPSAVRQAAREEIARCLEVLAGLTGGDPWRA